MNDAIEKVLYMPPKSKYNAYSFYGSCTYYEIDGISGGCIPVVYIKPMYTTQYTIVYSHANAEDIGQLRSFLRNMAQLVYCEIVSYDYPGYGRNTEDRSESSVKATGVQVVEYLMNNLHINPGRIILFGHSLGSAVSVFVSTYLAEKKNVQLAGVILQSCFLSVYRVASFFRNTSKNDMYPTYDIIDKIRCPVCLIHGINDCIVPIYHAKNIFLRIPPKYRCKNLFVEHAGHNNIESWCSPASEYSRFISRFLEYVTRFWKNEEVRDLVVDSVNKNK